MPYRQDLLYAQRLQILLGQETQTTRCPWYATSGDDDDYPGYRGSVTVWLENVDLTPSYNQIAQYQFEVVNSDGSIAEIVTAECEYAGVSAARSRMARLLSAVNGWIMIRADPAQKHLRSTVNR